MNLCEVHYAAIAWHSYQTLSETTLRHFANFDWGYPEELDPRMLEVLLTKINDGQPVTKDEVKRVMSQASSAEGAAINRADLLGAIATWYVHVDREDTSWSVLLQEAVARALHRDWRRLFRSGVRNMGLAIQNLQSNHDGYAPASGYRGSTFYEGIWREAPEPPRVRGTAPLCCYACLELGCIAIPVIVCGLLIVFGAISHTEVCERNFAGLLVWFGTLGLLFCISMCVEIQHIERLRITLVAVMSVLVFVGVTWSSGEEAVPEECGEFIITFSHLLWISIAVGAAFVTTLMVLTTLRKLKYADHQIQQGGLWIS